MCILFAKEVGREFGGKNDGEPWVERTSTGNAEARGRILEGAIRLDGSSTPSPPESAGGL